MSTVFMDGRVIDTTIWIDRNVARFKNRGLSWALRRNAVLQEIADYQIVLDNFGTVIPLDPPGEAHTKVYLAALRRTEQEMMREVREGFRGSPR